MTEPLGTSGNAAFPAYKESAFLWLKCGDQRIVGCFCLLGFAMSVCYWSNLSKALQENTTENRILQSQVYRLDLNAASENRLMLLNGIGPALSHRIVEYREKYGSFESVHDLQRVKGIGPRKLEAIRRFVLVDR